MATLLEKAKKAQKECDAKVDEAYKAADLAIDAFSSEIENLVEHAAEDEFKEFIVSDFFDDNTDGNKLRITLIMLFCETHNANGISLIRIRRKEDK